MFFFNLIFFRSSESKVAEVAPAPSNASGDEHKQRGEESVPHGLPNGDVKSLGGKQAPPVVSINSSVDREGATSPRGQVSELNSLGIFLKKNYKVNWFENGLYQSVIGWIIDKVSFS